MILLSSHPRGWKRVKVQDIAKRERGSTVTGPFGSNIGRKFFVDEGVPVIRGNNLTKGKERFIDDGFVFITEKKADELRRCEAIPDDLVFTAAGTLGQIGLIPKDCKYPRYIISNKQMRLRCDTNMALPLHLYYWFISPYMIKFIENHSTGTSIPLINLGILRSLPINLPPLIVQKIITSILSTYDDLLNNNRRRIQILEEMARALYREWFVHFRFPGHEGVEMVDSELGEIPGGWEVKKLKEVMELAYGKGLRKKDRILGEFPVYGSSGIIDYHREKLVDGPGIIVGRKGNPGRVNWSQIGFYPIDTTYYVSTDLSLYYVYYALDEMEFIDTHTAVPGLSRNSAYLKDFLVPNSEIITRFENLATRIFSMKHNLKTLNATLQKIRDLLLPRLVSGQIDVSNMEIEVPTDNHQTSKYSEQSSPDQRLDGDDENDPS